MTFHRDSGVTFFLHRMIKVNELNFRYAGGLPDVLKGISTTISSNSFVTVMGSNGSGKSTFARCLNGLLVPTLGEVTVDGFLTKDSASCHEVRRRVGLVFQDPNLQMTSATVERELAFGLENVRMDRSEMRKRVGEYLRLFGFEERKDDPPSSLSAGERQQLAVGAVLILKPSYLILDEATSLLSARSRRTLLDLVIGLHRAHGISLILITQYPSEAQLGERLLVLHQGNIVFDDHPDNVFRQGDTLVRMGVAIPVRERLSMAV